MSNFGDMIELHIDVTQFYRARDMIRMANDGNTYRGMFKDYIEKRLPLVVERVKKLTPVKSGELQKSHMWQYDSHRMEGRIFINPRAVWLEGRSTIRWPKVYGPIVHDRWKAFYADAMPYAERLFRDGFRTAVERIPWP